jgi:16S rRNA (cytosine1402-N4)-methyltransferase
MEIGKILGQKGRLICLDRDPNAIELAKKRLRFLSRSVKIIKANYAEMGVVLPGLGISGLNGILLDLGMSSFQLESSGKGFSFSRDEPLDMRMDPDQEITAGYLVNNLSLGEIEKLLRDYGEEKRAKIIAGAIVRARKEKQVKTSSQLAAIIKSVSPPTRRSKNRHPATLSFQALRIAVNTELENLKLFLDEAPSLLIKGGRLVVLSYHSLEDRIVKQRMRTWEKGCICPPDFPVCVCGKEAFFRRVTKRGIRPSDRETEVNPRSRSAIMRVAERI